jgi:hypothetical protein
MEMVYVERRADGSICGVYANPQPGYAEEEISSDAAEVVAFVTPTQRAPSLVEYACEARWRREVGGVVFNGLLIPTDDRAKLLILGAAQTLTGDAVAPFIANGVNYGMLTAGQFQAINAAVVAHVQSTFSVLATVLKGIESGAVISAAQIDAAFL